MDSYEDGNERMSKLPSMRSKTYNDYQKWLADNLPTSSRVGVDGTLLTLQSGDALQDELSPKSIELVCEAENCVDLIWKDRPAIPCTPVTYLTPSDAGCSVQEKVELVSNTKESSQHNMIYFIIHNESPNTF